MTKVLFGKEQTFYSSTPTLIEQEDGYLLHLRWINYVYHADGSKKVWPDLLCSLYSRCKLDKHFNAISEEEFLKEDDHRPSWGNFGPEDIRLFRYENQDYYTATSHDTEREVVAISSGVYNMDTFELPVQPIHPSFYQEKRHEKNWAFVPEQKSMTFVYEWYPLQLTEMNHETRQLNRIVTKPMPDFFKEARGSTNGCKLGRELWFLVHRRRSYVKQNIFYLEYHHCFVVFDLTMNLKRYSEWFTFANHPIEFCLSMILSDTQLILSYSLLDIHSYVSIYDVDSLRRLKWVSTA